MKKSTAIVALAMATALAACAKQDKPAQQAAEDIKAMGAQRDQAKEALKELEASQQKAAEAAAKAADGEEATR
ncbi:hypothetical protein ABT364_17005 [Massilia sp. SR12]